MVTYLNTKLQVPWVGDEEKTWTMKVPPDSLSGSPPRSDRYSFFSTAVTGSQQVSTWQKLQDFDKGPLEIKDTMAFLYFRFMELLILILPIGLPTMAP